MIIYQDAVNLAITNRKWKKHPNPKRKGQEIQLVADLGSLWESDTPKEDVPSNACVVHDKNRQIFCVYDDRYRQDCTADHKHL